MKIVKMALRFVLATFFVSVGVDHFVHKEFYVSIMPPYIPWHLACVYISGAFEIGLGVMLAIPQTSRLAGWGLILLLIAVFPANIQVYTHQELVPLGPTLHLLRLPLQAVLIAWAYWYTRPDRPMAPGRSAEPGGVMKKS